MIIKESKLRKIIREVLLESDETKKDGTKKMDASIFRMMAPASLANKGESKPKIVSPKPSKPSKPSKFDYNPLANLIVIMLEKDQQIVNKNIDIRNEKFLFDLMIKVKDILDKREEDVRKMSIS